MVRLRSIGLVGLTLLAILTRTAWAETLRIPAGESLIDALARTQPGDTLLLGPGSHAGPVLITVPGITLEGLSGAVIDGGGSGDSIHVSAADVTLRHLTVRHSGQVLIDKNSGIFLDRDADRARVEDCELIDNLIAVYLDGPKDAIVRNNRITGLHLPHRTERGPAVSLWNTPGSRIEDNDIRSGRDGVFAVGSRKNVIARNQFHDLRFAVHFMYTNDSEVADNISAGNDVGFVFMYSDRLAVHGNASVPRSRSELRVELRQQLKL